MQVTRDYEVLRIALFQRPRASSLGRPDRRSSPLLVRCSRLKQTSILLLPNQAKCSDQFHSCLNSVGSRISAQRRDIRPQPWQEAQYARSSYQLSIKFLQWYLDLVPPPSPSRHREQIKLSNLAIIIFSSCSRLHYCIIALRRSIPLL
jgi:hypothetical protein